MIIHYHLAGRRTSACALYYTWHDPATDSKLTPDPGNVTCQRCRQTIAWKQDATTLTQDPTHE